MINTPLIITPKTGRHIDQIGWDKVLTKKEQEQINSYLDSLDMSDLRNRQLRVIYKLFVNTGLREGELVMLRMRDCPQYLGSNAIEVYRGKGNKDRTIPMSPQRCKELQDYIDQVRPKTRPRWCKENDIKGLVFFNFKRKALIQICKIIDKKGKSKQQIRASSTIYRMIRNLGESSGLTKRVYPHMLRHTFAVNALVNGVNIYVLSKVMGHADITTTARYLHLAGMQLETMGKTLDNG